MKWNPFKKKAPEHRRGVEVVLCVAGVKHVLTWTVPPEMKLTEFEREAQNLKVWATGIQLGVNDLQRYVEAAKNRCVEKDKAMAALRNQYEALYQKKLHWGLQVKHDQAACGRDAGTADLEERLVFTAVLNGEHAVLSGKVAGLKLEELALQARLKDLRSRVAAAEAKKTGKGKAK